MLWDGKDRGLEAQALRAIIVRVELRGDSYPREMAVDSVLTRLRNVPDYVELFNRAFPAEADSSHDNSTPGVFLGCSAAGVRYYALDAGACHCRI